MRIKAPVKLIESSDISLPRDDDSISLASRQSAAVAAPAASPHHRGEVISVAHEVISSDTEGGPLIFASVSPVITEESSDDSDMEYHDGDLSDDDDEEAVKRQQIFRARTAPPTPRVASGATTMAAKAKPGPAESAPVNSFTGKKRIVLAVLLTVIGIIVAFIIGRAVGRGIGNGAKINTPTGSPPTASPQQMPLLTKRPVLDDINTP